MAEIEDNTDEVEASRAPLLSHLEELRTRLIWSLAAIAAMFVVCFIYAEWIYNLLLIPFEDAARTVRGEQDLTLQLIFTAPLEFFFVKLKLALFGAVVLAFPVLAYQIWAFVRPGLYKNERLAFAPFLVAAPVLFAAGLAFVYFVILPFVMGFALGQEQIGEDGPQIQLLTRVSEYLNLVTTLALAFGISFQLPVLLSLLGKAGIITSMDLIKFWKFALIGIATFAAFVTPPDPISQLFLGAAMFGLYGLSILAVKLVEPKPEPEEA